MKPNIREFVDLAGELIAVLELLIENATEESDWMKPFAEAAITNMREFIDMASRGDLPSSDGAGLGISRGLGEWAPPHVCKLGNKVEKCFIEKC